MGRRATQKIPPGIFWRSQVFIDHPVHLKFNVSLGKAALVGIYGRKGLPPSHTQVIGPQLNNTCLQLYVLILSYDFSYFYQEFVAHLQDVKEKENHVTIIRYLHALGCGQQNARGGKGFCGLVVAEGISWLLVEM